MSDDIEYIRSKTILSKLKNGPDPYFGITYNINLYRGCQHQCIYCDSRSEVYQLGDLSSIKLKENSLDLLDLALYKRPAKGTIGTGSMNDPYMAIEQEMGFTSKALEIINKYRYPVHIITKSDLVVRDTDLIKDISKVYSAVSLTITTVDDSQSTKIEPRAPVSSKRFEALSKLRQNGIYAGVLVMPILPYINNTEENIIQLVEKSYANGAAYVLFAPGVTLRDVQRDYYYSKLDDFFPGVRSLYEKTFGNRYNCTSPNEKILSETFYNTCAKRHIPTSMIFFKENNPIQSTLF
ncbi:MAG: radical SAM protein [Bacteroidales bacterium]|nr:radical SAM protein [Bacteroidales bacterium]